MELHIDNLTKKYGEKVALDGFSFVFRCGIYGIIGANGAGKTTLMNLITDNVKRDSGSILWEGEDILKLGASFRATVGYMPQQSGIYPEYSAREFLRYMAELKELPRKEAYLQIEEILKVSEPASFERRRVERFSNEYWTLVWMTQQGSGWQTDSIPVYHPDDRWFFLIPEAAYEYKNRYSGRITPGEVRRVELLKADPVQMRAQFRFVYGSTATDGGEEIIEEDYYEDEEENTEDKENTQETGKD